MDRDLVTLDPSPSSVHMIYVKAFFKTKVIPHEILKGVMDILKYFPNKKYIHLQNYIFM